MVDNIYLGLGSNLGDRTENLKFAIDKINENSLCRVIKSSAVYETSPYGDIKQDNFYNAVIEVSTALGFFDLYYLLKSIESKAGRPAIEERWGPRVLDIDIVFYNQLIFNGDNLIIPHAEYAKRDFVVIPLLEIAADFKNPLLRKKLNDIQFDFEETHIIKKISDSLL